MFLCFVITFMILLWLIKFQRKKKIGQTEREEGLNTHKKKNNTPIFGGVSFVIGYVISFTLMLVIDMLDIYMYLLIVFPLISYSLIGFVDDLIILKNKKNDGLKPNLKFFLQIIIAIIYFILYLTLKFDTKINFIFFTLDLMFFYGIFILLSFVGLTNAFNLTDGIDGLLAGTLSIILIGIFLITNDNFMQNIIAIIFAGLSAFLYFNLPKAKIFMGDTGSLALGSIFVSLLIMMKLEIFLIIFGFIYILEALSVVIQVLYFKRTNGKRIFKMSPIHHHFEIVFDSEIKTLILFYLFTCITVIFGVIIYYNLYI